MVVRDPHADEAPKILRTGIQNIVYPTPLLSAVILRNETPRTI